MLDAHPAPAAPARAPAAVSAPAIAEPAVPQPEPRSAPAALLAAARTLLPVLEAGRPLDARTLREAMTRAFGASDADGAWLWKDSYEAAEAALVLFLQRYGRAMRREAGAGPGGPAAMLRMLGTLAALEPSQTRRSEEQLKYQQFSTPLPLAYAALQAAMIRPGDVVLEPSAGTGMLAVMAQLALGTGATGALHLNEIAAARAGGRRPVLDCLVATPSALIGIESKRYEPFRGAKTAHLSDTYWRPVWGARMKGYERVRDLLSKNPHYFAFLDAAQLVKHAFGLRSEVYGPGAHRGLTPFLYYVYAEPKSWPGTGRRVDAAAITGHREEIVSFARLVEGDEVTFVSCTHHRLLEAWLRDHGEEIGAHARAVTARFSP